MTADDSLAMSERRQEPRMHIVLPVNFDDALGQTENISASGIYVTFANGAAQHVQPGSSVRLEMLFEHATPDGPLKVACEGDVVRVERRGDQLGVAARITSYRFGDAGVVDREPRPIARQLDLRAQGRRELSGTRPKGPESVQDKVAEQ